MTVTATVLDDYGWGYLTVGRTSTTTATFTVVLVAASCDDALPAPPTVTQALCRDGVVGDAAVTVGPTDGIAYTCSVPPPYAEGDW